MKKTKRPVHLKRNTFTVNVFDNVEMRVIARFPYDVTDDLDAQCAYIRAKMFVKEYAHHCDFKISQFSLVDSFDNSVNSVI